MGDWFDVVVVCCKFDDVVMVDLVLCWFDFGDVVYVCWKVN